MWAYEQLQLPVPGPPPGWEPPSEPPRESDEDQPRVVIIPMWDNDEEETS